MDQIEVIGLRIAYELAGKGPALVLLHGHLCDCRVWRRQLDDLSDDFTVLAWDAPGCGKSSDPPDSFRMPEYADCLAEFLATLGMQRVHVLGLSFGSVLALELYRRHPTTAMTLMLASAYAGWAGSLPPATVDQRLQRALREADLPAHQVVHGYISDFFTDAAPPEVIDEVAAIMGDFHPVGVRAMAYASAEADLRGILPRINVPTLLLYGDGDRRSPLNVATDLYERIPNANLVVMPRVGHLSNVEAADRFNVEVRRFLRSVLA